MDRFVRYFKDVVVFIMLAAGGGLGLTLFCFVRMRSLSFDWLADTACAELFKAAAGETAFVRSEEELLSAGCRK
jgi:hypothetical protein